MRMVLYVFYGMVLLGVYALVAFFPESRPSERTVSRVHSPDEVRAARLRGLSRLDEAAIAGAPHDWNRLFAGPNGAVYLRGSPGSGGYYRGRGGFGGGVLGGGGYHGGGWFGGK